jgi:hypothetical protein
MPVFSIKEPEDETREEPYWTRERLHEHNVKILGRIKADEIENRTFCLQVAQGDPRLYDELYHYTGMSKVWELLALQKTLRLNG